MTRTKKTKTAKKTAPKAKAAAKAKPAVKAVAKAAAPKYAAKSAPSAAPRVNAPERGNFMWKLLERKEAELKRRQELRETADAHARYGSPRRRGA